METALLRENEEHFRKLYPRDSLFLSTRSGRTEKSNSVVNLAKLTGSRREDTTDDI